MCVWAQFAPVQPKAVWLPPSWQGEGHQSLKLRSDLVHVCHALPDLRVTLHHRITVCLGAKLKHVHRRASSQPQQRLALRPLIVCIYGVHGVHGVQRALKCEFSYQGLSSRFYCECIRTCFHYVCSVHVSL